MSHSIDCQFYQDTDTFFKNWGAFALTYDDVSLATRFSSVLPRATRVDTRLSNRLALSIPIISADMDTVTEARMAIAMALNGGLGLIHYNMSEKQQIKEVHKVKNHIHGLISDPIRVHPDESIGDVLNMIEERRFGFRTFPVVDDQNTLLGLLSGRVVKERYRSHIVRDAMTPRKEVYTLQQSEIEQQPISAADRFFNEHMGIHKLLVVDDKDKLCGLFTLSDIERITEEARADVKPARDSEFRLACGVAISTSRTAEGDLDRDRIVGHVGALVDAGVNAIAVSTAHGHSSGVGESVKLLREQFPELTIIAGNVTSGEGVEYLSDCGADAIKVGQGPGSICTTRIVAGVGIPQLTALYLASQVAAKKGVRIIADGGVNKSGDIVKALTMADAVMLGGMMAGCQESPGSIVEINGKFYKQYRGMGSLAAMKEGSAARYGHQYDKSRKETNNKIAAEGVEALKELSGSADEMLSQLVGGIQSGMGYLGAETLRELREQARFVRVSPAGQRESAPHDVVEVKTTKSNK